MRHPIDHIEWVHVKTLTSNHWNPNHVFGAELTLLEHSLIVEGWTQPILTKSQKDRTIVDGFHRSILAGLNDTKYASKALLKRDGGMVPIAALDKDTAQAMASTVRMNRAKGTHEALKMSELVQTLIDVHGLTAAIVGREIGANLDEVNLLYAGGVFKARKLDGRDYSKAWIPREDGRHSSERHQKI